MPLHHTPRLGIRAAPRRRVTAGASAREILVSDVAQALIRIEPSAVSNLEGLKENVSFRLPAELIS